MTEQTQTYLDVYGTDNQFLLRTTMPVLRTMLDLHRDAVARIEREINQPGGVSEMHFNRRPNCLAQAKVMIQLAVGPRANY